MSWSIFATPLATSIAPTRPKPQILHGYPVMYPKRLGFMDAFSIAPPAYNMMSAPIEASPVKINWGMTSNNSFARNTKALRVTKLAISTIWFNKVLVNHTEIAAKASVESPIFGVS